MDRPIKVDKVGDWCFIGHNGRAYPGVVVRVTRTRSLIRFRIPSTGMFKERWRSNWHYVWTEEERAERQRDAGLDHVLEARRA